MLSLKQVADLNRIFIDRIVLVFDGFIKVILGPGGRVLDSYVTKRSKTGMVHGSGVTDVSEIISTVNLPTVNR